MNVSPCRPSRRVLTPPAGCLRRGPRRDGRPSGFTITELLVVIGIIVALIAILLPVVTRIRKAGYNTTSSASLASLQGAIEVYYQNFRAYPGPVSNATICGQAGAAPMPQNLGGNLTMSENLLLGLVGGLANTGLGIAFDPTRTTRGPLALISSVNPRQYDPILKISVARSPGRFSNTANSPQANDSMVPEFMDSFVDTTLPFLYFRANPGATSMVAGATFSQTQYDPLQNFAYTGVAIGPPDKVNGNPGSHGLQIAGNPAVPPSRFANPLGPYLYGSRGKDSYILIGAGPDRTYGTGDDNASFGSVLP